MENLFSSEVIEAAAKSNLGVLSLMILILGAISLAFFRTSGTASKLVVFVILFFGVSGFGYTTISAMDLLEATQGLTKPQSDELIRIGTSQHTWVGRSPNDRRIILPPVDRAKIITELTKKGLVQFSYPSTEFSQTINSLQLIQIPVPDLGDPARPAGQVFESSEPVPQKTRRKIEAYKYSLTKNGLQRFKEIQDYVN